MGINTELLEKLKLYRASHRKLTDDIFADDKPPARLGVYDDDEDLSHTIVNTRCSIPGCNFIGHNILEFENHYNASHRYSCAQCKKVLPSPHLLDLHVQENHDSFFAVLAERKPSYCCYIEECKEKFKSPAERLDHCVTRHKLPKDFRFEVKKKSKCKKSNTQENIKESMETDSAPNKKDFKFSNSKAKTFSNKYTGRQFTSDEVKTRSIEVDMDILLNDIKDTLPE